MANESIVAQLGQIFASVACRVHISQKGQYGHTKGHVHPLWLTSRFKLFISFQKCVRNRELQTLNTTNCSWRTGGGRQTTFLAVIAAEPIEGQWHAHRHWTRGLHFREISYGSFCIAGQTLWRMLANPYKHGDDAEAAQVWASCSSTSRALF